MNLIEKIVGICLLGAIPLSISFNSVKEEFFFFTDNILSIGNYKLYETCMQEYNRYHMVKSGNTYDYDSTYYTSCMFGNGKVSDSVKLR